MSFAARTISQPAPKTYLGAPVYLGDPPGATYWSSTNVVSTSTCLMVIVGTTNFNNTAAFSRSLDGGLTWSTPAYMNNSSTTIASMQAVVTKNNLIVVIGLNNSDVFGYCSSTDGITWSTFTTNSDTGIRPAGMAYSQTTGRFVVVGTRYMGYVGGKFLNASVYTTSTDGTTWSASTFINGSTADCSMQTVEANASGKFVALGTLNNLSTPAAAVATSSDGINWTSPVALPGISISTFFYNVTALNSSNTWAAVGNYFVANVFTGPVSIISTDNGSTWSYNYLPTGGNKPSAVTIYRNTYNQIIAAGQYQNPPGSSNYVSVAWSSADGINYTLISAGATFLPYAMNGTNGSVVTIGSFNFSGLYYCYAT